MPRQVISGFVLLCTVLSSPVYAKKIYKFQDESGHWHYSDKAPSGPGSAELNLDVKQLQVKAKQRVWLNKHGKKQHPEFVIRNDFLGPIEVELSLIKQRNVRVSPALPDTFVILPGISEPLIQLQAKNEFLVWQYSLSYRYTLGNPSAKHNEQARYYPPFAHYRQYRITQAFHGQFSHKDDQNKYAVDFAMPEGSEVHAARAGVVMSVDNDFFRGGIDKQAYKVRANSIRILHDDGSMAVYAHLQLERAQVYEGMRVRAGQLIAYSGNTGFSSGPHLHFSVQVNQGMSLVSVPFKFVDQQGELSEPGTGQWLSGLVVAE